MNHPKILAVLGVTSLAVVTLVRSRADDGVGQSAAGAPPDSTRRADPCPGCVKIFDGKTFRGWEADPSTWSIVEGAMRGVGGRSPLAYTTADYGSFRVSVFRFAVRKRGGLL